MIDLNELQKAAEAATQGQWAENDDKGCRFIETANDNVIAKVFAKDISREEFEANSKLIAMCSPANILEIVGQLKAAKELLECRNEIKLNFGDLSFDIVLFGSNCDSDILYRFFEREKRLISELESDIKAR